jgi:DEAD/DEAH box helicase domain-containing protein
LHLGKAYKVAEWRTQPFDRSIRVYASKSPVTTRAILRRTVTLSLAADGIVEGRIKKSATGLVAETQLQVNESVEGYTIGKTNFLYKDLRATDPNMSRKQRDFRTTGVIIRIEEDWFAGSDSRRTRTREALSKALLDLLSRDRSISPNDIDATHTNIALLTETGPKRLTDAIVIYDSVYGGLRLTEDLFAQLPAYLGQLAKGADLAGDEAMIDEETVDRIIEWSRKLEAADPTAAAAQGGAPDGWYQVYKPGSYVSILFNGNFVERKLGNPKLIDPFGTGTPILFYEYEMPNGAGAVPHDQIQSTGHDWSWAQWNPETGEILELDDVEHSREPAAA